MSSATFSRFGPRTDRWDEVQNVLNRDETGYTALRSSSPYRRAAVSEPDAQRTRSPLTALIAALIVDRLAGRAGSSTPGAVTRVRNMMQCNHLS